MKYLIGLDIGTSAVKGALLRENGTLAMTASGKFEYRIEGEARFLDPDRFCETCFGVIRELAAAAVDSGQAGFEGGKAEIAAICSCCASGNPVFLDSGLRPITPIIGWQTKVSREILSRVYTRQEQDDFYRIVGWPLGSGMPAANLAWISVNRPDILERTRFLAMSAEYFNYRLTGKWGISHSMGTPSFLIDQEQGRYNKKLLGKFGLSEEMLPPIYAKGTVLGTVLPEMAAGLGVGKDTVIVLGTFDHPSGALGAGVLEEGEMLLSCGTSWVEFFPVASREFALSTGGLVDRFLLDGAPYCVMKSLTSVNELISERRKTLLGTITHREYDDLILASSPGSGGLAFDFTDDDYSRAAGFGKPEIARAIIEGAAVRLRNNLTELRKCGLRADNITAIGGITNSQVCVDVIAGVLGQHVNVAVGQAAGAVGSCLLAGVGIGLFASEKEAVRTMLAGRRQSS